MPIKLCTFLCYNGDCLIAIWMHARFNYKCETLDPDNPDGPRICVEIPVHLYERLYKYAPVRYENLRAVKHVLKNPERIFAGLRKLHEGGWCYTGVPEMWYIKPQVVVPFPDHLVFAVYVNPRKVVFEFGAERVDSDDPFSPIDWDKRYGAPIWKSTS